MKNTILIFLCLLSTVGFAQNTFVGKVSGTVVEENKKNIEYVTVTLHQAKDSVLVKGGLTDNKGVFEIENIKQGQYFIRITHIGFQKYSGPPFEISESAPSLILPAIALNAASATLGAVTVTAQKPFIERKLDRLIVNVENSIVNAGGSVLEVLERSPNVFVNQENSINLKGKSGVIVMIDGKPTPLAGADLIQYLKSIPSASIEKIELITNPSAKYDAAGNAGIIDIKFKRDKRLGLNGSLTVSDGQGFYNKLNASTNLNFRTKKWNLFGSYAYGRPTGFTRFYINRKFFNPDRSIESIFDQTSFIRQPIQSHTTRLGADFYATKKTIIGAMLNTNLVNSAREGFTNSIIANPNGAILYTTESDNKLHAKNFNGFGNVNLKHTFDSTGRELTADVDYGQYDANTFQNFKVVNLNTERNPLSQNILETDQKGIITVQSVKADYVHPLKNQAKFETGLKSSLVKTDNDIQFFDIIDGKKIVDNTRSNHFIYSENVNAAYANFNQEFKKMDIQFGLRMEHTVTNGQQVTTGEAFSRNYVNFFPSAVINRKFSDNNQLSLSYSRRIDRPSYRQLNPFRIFVDPPYTFVVGDPQLRPVYTHAFELSHTFKGRYITELSYSRSKDVITDVFVQDDVTRVSNQIPANLQHSEAITFAVIIPFSVRKWLNSNFSGNIYWNKYESPFQGGNLLNQNTAWDARCQNSIVLGKGWTAELTGVYQARLVWGLFTIKDLGHLSAGIQKMSRDKNSTFRLNVSDMFYTNRIAVVVQYQNMDFFTNRTWDGRVATLSFTHRFGKNTVQQARRRSSGVEDEKRRAG